MAFLSVSLSYHFLPFFQEKDIWRPKNNRSAEKNLSFSPRFLFFKLPADGSHYTSYRDDFIQRPTLGEIVLVNADQGKKIQTQSQWSWE